jgi:hypothetical protein
MRTVFVVLAHFFCFCIYRPYFRLLDVPLYLSIARKMPRNVEIKAKIKCLPTLLDTASKLCSGAKPQIIKQHDTFFTSKAGRLKLREFPGDEKVGLQNFL